MMIRAYNQSDFDSLYKYYQKVTKAEGLYVLFDEISFKLLLNNPCYISIVNVQIDGFILGSMIQSEGFIDMIYSNHIYEPLLMCLESYLQTQGIKTVWFSYKSFIKKPFYAFQKHIHANAQGISVDNPLLDKLTAFGYLKYQSLSTYHLDLERFVMPEVISNTEETLLSSNIKIDFYNPNDLGMEDFYKKMHNKDFENSIRNNFKKPIPNDLLVATKDNHVIGFAGPISVFQHRGIFHGISVLDEYQGLKIGKVLFFKMCNTFKRMNASYVTLFTGDNNPARFLYEQAGFIRVRTFWMLKKEL